MSSPGDEKTMLWDAGQMYKSGGFWHGARVLVSVNAFKANFQPARDDVVVLASMPKAGTTWLKSLSHCILFRDVEEEDDLLTKMNPHNCVPTFETALFSGDPANFPAIDPDRRLFHTHVSYSSLPNSITNHSPGCKLVYMARDPKDTLVSMWHFYNKILRPLPLETTMESFCSGVIPFGPFYEHMLEYWEQSKRSPDKVMFIKYEDLRRDPKSHVRKLAAFLGRPFRNDEEVEKVIWRSSFDRLKDLDVNKNDSKSQVTVLAPLLKNSHFFRRGEVGDWRNHLTMEMAERIDNVTRMKLQGLVVPQAPSYSDLSLLHLITQFLRAIGRGILAFPIGALIHAAVAIVLGAPVGSRYLLKTINWSLLMSSLTEWPICVTYGSLVGYVVGMVASVVVVLASSTGAKRRRLKGD
ncbi:Cytosolic sulfotransferase 15 [Linum perenne]